MSFLELKTLSKRYGDVTAVAECNLSIKEGEFVCLLGPSGCGKTTTLQMVAGFVEPTAGSILLNGQDITGLKPSKRGLGIVFQSYALFPHMTVAENVSFGLEMRKIDSAERTRRVKEAIDMVHLGPMANRYPKELSGGQRQRVAMARALVIRPPVLLLDEPMGALDAKLRDEMQIELRALQKSLGITTIMVTHDQAEAMTLADTVVLMNKGAIEQVGSPLEIYERPEDRFASTFLGRANVFQAQSDDGVTVQAKGIPLPCTGPTPLGPLEYMVRPEKIVVGDPSASALSGSVQLRVFLGNHWLYEVATALGKVQITQTNVAAPSVKEGDTVGLLWMAEHARILPRRTEG